MSGYYIVVGMTDRGEIGTAENQLIVESQDDLKRFYNITTSHYPEGNENILIMGYKTWISIPVDKRPLKKRISIILTNNHYDEMKAVEDGKSVVVKRSLQEAFDYADNHKRGRTFVIGGEVVYRECNTYYRGSLRGIYMTYYQTGLDRFNMERFASSKRFPAGLISECVLSHKSSPEEWEVVSRYGYPVTETLTTLYKVYQPTYHQNKAELEYIRLLNDVLKEGQWTESRNSRVKSVFGERMVFDLKDGFPLLTTKRMGYKTILRELLWFLSGSTDNRVLRSQNVKIWNDNGSREFLDSRGLKNNPVDDLGPIYGFQWRHFGADYQGTDHDYQGQGIDQVKEVLRLIREEPESRRIILSAWNPAALNDMALPPCHVMCQFYVNSEDQSLDCQLYQRSGDLFLGVPFNIASYAFLTHIFAHLSGLKVGRFIHILGDAHIYESHIEAASKQVIRLPVLPPTLSISEDLQDIDHISEDMFEMYEYQSYPKIEAPMIA